MSTPKPKSLKQLTREWDKRLKDSGFEDIEQRDGRLKRWESHFFKQRPDVEFQEAKTSYYRMAGYFLHEHKFEDDVIKLIWQLHSEGLGQRTIIKELKHRGLRGHFNFVGSTIRTLAALMKKRYANG